MHQESSNSLSLLIAFMLTLLVALGCFNTFVPRAPVPVTSWEYKIESIPDTNFTQTINNIGKDGWELVFARRATDKNISDLSEGETMSFSYEVIFKRPSKTN